MKREYYYYLEEYAIDTPTINRVSTEDIKHLAIYIIENFEPVSSVTAAEGYISALTFYSMSNNDFPYSDVFNKIKYGQPSSFLFTNVTLALLEKDFRENGVNENNINSYNKWLKEYQRQLNYGIKSFADLYKKSQHK